MYQGNLNSSLVRVSELFKPAIRRNSAAILVAHNHQAAAHLARNGDRVAYAAESTQIEVHLHSYSDS